MIVEVVGETSLNPAARPRVGLGERGEQGERVRAEITVRPSTVTTRPRSSIRESRKDRHTWALGQPVADETDQRPEPVPVRNAGGDPGLAQRCGVTGPTAGGVTVRESARTRSARSLSPAAISRIASAAGALVKVTASSWPGRRR